MKIEFSVLLGDNWGTVITDTEKNFCYPCPSHSNGHFFDFHAHFIAFETLKTEHEEGELKCSCKTCSYTLPYKIKKL